MRVGGTKLRLWSVATIGELTTVNPSQPESIPQDDALVSFLPMKAVEAMTNRLDASHRRPWREVKKGYVRFQDGDVLFAKITPCMENGKVVLASGLHNGAGAGSTEFHILRPREVLSPLFLTYHLLQDGFRRDAQRRMTGTAGQLRVPASCLEEATLHLPPIKEQHRIVEAIESYFTRLDDAVANLERVKANLKRYRASVLKAAVEGRLVPTEAELARQEGRDYEPASVLLERILKKRRRSWEEAELAKMEAKGKPPKDDRWKKKYKEPVTPDTSNLPELPEGWRWASVDQLAESTLIGLVRNRSQQSSAPPGEPYLRMDHVQTDGTLDLSTVVFVKVSKAELEKFSVVSGDILFNTRNSVELVGKAGLVTESASGAVFNNNLMRIRIDPACNPRFVNYEMSSRLFRDQVDRVKRATTSVAAVYAKDLLPRAIAVPPLAEQCRIASRCDEVMSDTNVLSLTAGVSVNRSARLRQSILKWAFEGRLVDQDPTDEPAAVLLERIKAERETPQPKKAKKPHRSRRKKTA